MERRSRLIGVVTVLLTIVSLAIIAQRGGSTETTAAASRIGGALKPEPAAAPIRFSGGAPSIDALIDEFLDAVEHRDTGAMHRLRVTKDEYLKIIVPGTADEGQPPRQISEDPQQFFWALTDRKSRYAADTIIERFSGLHFTERSLRFSRGSTKYLWYTAYGQVRLDLRLPGNPDVFELRTGTIAEVGGRYKFLAFNWNE